MERKRYSNFDLKTGIIKTNVFIFTFTGGCITEGQRRCARALEHRSRLGSAVPHIYSIYGNQTLLVRQTCDGQEDVLAGGKLIRKCNGTL